MKFKRAYKNLNDTLQYMRVQIAAGIPWAEQNAPVFTNAADCYYWLMDRVNYRHDPPQTELLQSIDTLLTSRNFWGQPGAGDCDCMVIAWLTLFNCSNMKGRAWVKLAGRSKQYPVHIWSGIDYDGRELAADLTQRKFNSERSYPYIQKIYYKPL